MYIIRCNHKKTLIIGYKITKNRIIHKKYKELFDFTCNHQIKNVNLR